MAIITISQHTFSAPLDDPSAFQRVPAGGPTACVFELTVHAHERGAFVRHVLNPGDGPRVEDYLAQATKVDSHGPLGHGLALLAELRHDVRGEEVVGGEAFFARGAQCEVGDDDFVEAKLAELADLVDDMGG